MTKKLIIAATPFLEAVRQYWGEWEYKNTEKQYRLEVRTLNQEHPATFDDWIRKKCPDLAIKFSCRDGAA